MGVHLSVCAVCLCRSPCESKPTRLTFALGPSANNFPKTAHTKVRDVSARQWEVSLFSSQFTGGEEMGEGREGQSNRSYHTEDSFLLGLCDQANIHTLTIGCFMGQHISMYK